MDTTYTDRDHNALRWMAEEAVVAQSQFKVERDQWMAGYWTGRLEALRLQALHVYGLTEDKWMELVEAASA